MNTIIELGEMYMVFNGINSKPARVIKVMSSCGANHLCRIRFEGSKKSQLHNVNAMHKVSLTKKRKAQKNG